MKIQILTILLIAVTFTKSSVAQIVSFNVSGSLDDVYNPQNLLPSSIIVGTPFTGTITYDPTGFSIQDVNASSAVWFYTGSGLSGNAG